MLENNKKTGNLSVSSKKKKRKTKKKDPKKTIKESKEDKEKRLLQEEEYQRRLDEQDSNFKSRVWDKNYTRVASLIQGQTEFNIENDNLMPFDFVATSDEEFDSHKNTVIEKIQNLLVQNKPDDSVSLFREARYLFLNDKVSFGTSEMSADEEFETFKNLFLKTLEIKREEINDEAKDEGLGDDEEMFCDEKDEFDNEEFGDQEETSTGFVVEEENFDFENFLFRYSHPKILKSFFLMLGEYEKNSDFLNRCCMSFLERIAYQCQTPQCLYQLSFFNLINKIYKDPMSRCCMNIIQKNTQKKSIDDLYDSTYSTEDMFAFFRKILSKFFEQTTKNPLMFLEILFFKDKKVLYELGEEYSGYKNLNTEAANGKNRKIAWTQEEQDELKELFEKYKRRFEANDDENYEDDIEDVINIKNQDAGDIIDLIMLNIKDGNRKRKDICTQLANLGCVHSVDVFKTSRYTFPNRKKMGRNRLWRDEDVDELRHSFFIISEEANQLNRPMNEMMGKLQACLKINRTKSCIIEKLLNLGLIKSKSEVIGSKKTNKNDNDEAKFIDDDEDQPKKEKKKKKKAKKTKENDLNNDLFDAESESGSDESLSSESESEDSESEYKNNTKEVIQDKELSDKSDKENSPVKLKSSSTREKVLEALNLNDDSNDLNIIINKKSKKISSDNEDDDNQLIQDILEKKNKTKKKKLNQVMSDESDEEFEKQIKKKSVSKKRKKLLDSDEDSKDSVASKDSVQKSSQVSEKEKLKLLKSDDESDEDEISNSLSSKRQKLFLSEDDE